MSEAIILAAAKDLGRERRFPGFLQQQANSLAANGGPCAWRGLQRPALTVEQLAECKCAKCSEWLAHRNGEVVAG